MTEVLDRLFPIQFSVDLSLSMTSLSSRLALHMPGVGVGASMLDVFSVHRPEQIDSASDITAHIDGIFLLVANNHAMALRGQFIADGQELRFVGVPWLAWMSRQGEDGRLGLADFPKFDSQMDQQFYITTQQSMVRDLEALNTELIELREAEREADRIRTDFFAVMSHEMRTPLNGVMSALGLLKDPRRTADRARLIEIACLSADQLMAVINHALDYSKMDAGAMELDIGTFRLAELVGGVMDIAMPRAREKELELQSSIASEMPAYFRGDVDKLRQILMNLVGNAIKYTDRGGITVTAWMESQEGPVYLQVSDTGCGIDQDQQEQIFRPYWTRVRGRSGETGTGLGLHICQRLVGLMDGEITVRSSPGEGSRFTVKLPLPPASSEPMVEQGAGSALTPERFRGHVLIVDDNETNLVLGEMILEGLGLEVTCAADGREAVACASTHSYDVILMDIAMPGMDGIETTQRILRTRPGLPVIALTAHVGTDLKGFYRSRGFSGYLRKPLEHDMLVEELSRWLEEWTVHEPPLAYDQLVRASRLENLQRRVGETNFIRIRRLFLAETERRIGLMLAAWVQRDLDQVKSHAHSLAGSVASFGGDQLVAELRAIEYACDKADGDAIIPHITRVERTARATLEQIRQIGSEGGSE